MARFLAALVALAASQTPTLALDCDAATAALTANAVGTRCAGFCGDSDGAFACVLRPAPLAGCDVDAYGGYRCVNGASCAVECLPVAPAATKWSIDWREARDNARGVVALTTQAPSAQPVVAFVSAPLASLDGLELPASVSELWLVGPAEAPKLLTLTPDAKLLTGFAALETLTLQDVQIADWDEVPAMPKLTTLTLVNAGLSHWPIAAVPDTLQHLEISRNAQLSDALVAATFPSSLQSLTLTRCGLQSLPAAGIQTLEALSSLSMAGNPLGAVATDRLPATLTHLSLRGCLLDAVPSSLESLQKLGTLDLSDNSLEAIVTGSLLLPSLTQLSLSNCSLQSFPFGDTAGQRLHTLDLSFNPLFPQSNDALESLAPLSSLDLSFTNLSRLPQAVLETVSKSISLSGNPLSELSWPSSSTVRFMNVSDCQLTNVPAQATTLQAMRVPPDDLSKNRLATVPDAIALSKTLRTLIIDANPVMNITRLPRQLTNLSAANCSLESLPPLGLEELQELDLRGNKLRSIDGLMASPRDTQRDLAALDLRGNHFASIPPLVWDLPALNAFKFQGNPVSPALRLDKRAIAWTTGRGVELDASSLDATSCKSPVRLTSGGLSVCAVADATTARDGSSSGSVRIPVRVMSAEQDAENRQTMVVTASVAGAVLLAVAVGLVFVYRGGGAGATASASRSAELKPKAEPESKPKSEPKPAAPSGAVKSQKAPSSSPDAELFKQWQVAKSELALEDEIAWGRSCAVFTAMYRGERVVVKRVLRGSESTFRAELALLAHFQHERIVRFVGVAWAGPQYRKPQLVLEYMPFGDLQTYLSTVFIEPPSSRLAQQYVHGRWDAGGAALTIALDVAEALEYAHSVAAVEFARRRVLTSRQVLLNAARRAKLSDFGSPQRVDNTTARWLAPEVLEGEANYSEAAEVYALGVVLWELDTCDLPYARFLPERDFGLSRVESSDEVELVWQRVAKGELRLAPRDDCPPLVRELIRRCLESEPFARPSMFVVSQTLREAAMLDGKSDAFAVGAAAAFDGAGRATTGASDTSYTTTPVKEEWI